jgi:hypothetical protein
MNLRFFFPRDLVHLNLLIKCFSSHNKTTPVGLSAAETIYRKGDDLCQRAVEKNTPSSLARPAIEESKKRDLLLNVMNGLLAVKSTAWILDLIHISHVYAAPDADSCLRVTVVPITGTRIADPKICNLYTGSTATFELLTSEIGVHGVPMMAWHGLAWHAIASCPSHAFAQGFRCIFF